MPLSQPPSSLNGFPETAGPDVLYRIHRHENGALFYSNDGGGRFDLRPPRGTLYCSASPRGAFIEVFRTPLIPFAEVQARVLSHLSITRPIRLPAAVGRTVARADRLRLADCTNAEARAFGVTAEIHATRDYAVCQRWAEAFAAAGFDGIAYLASHDPSAEEVAVAVFEDAVQSDRLAVGVVEAIDGTLIEEVEERDGIVVVPTPRSPSAVIGLRVDRESVRSFL
jgi:hypothetical protein